MRDRDLVLTRLLHGAGVDELVHQARGDLARLEVLPHLDHLCLELVKLRELCLRVGSLLLLRELLRLDLREGAPPFARHLQHVGRDAFRVYSKERVGKKEESVGTYC